jgi:hypothetical protein
MATSLLQRGEHAIVIFTYGRHFQKRKDGSGSTGDWVIDETRKCNKVVIYNRIQARNDIYVAKRRDIKPAKQPGRFVLKLSDIRYFGTTYFNWPQFAGSRNPVRYLKISSAQRSRRRSSNDDSVVNLSLLPPAE